MKENNQLTKTEVEILNAKQKEGLTNTEIQNKYMINNYNLRKIISKAKELGVYDEEKIKKAKYNRKSRERAKLIKEHPELKLTTDEEMYKKKCIKILSEQYLDYLQTGKFNPLLVARLKKLNEISSYKIIYTTIELQKDNLQYAHRNKHFANQNQKISYLLAIIKNSLGSTRKTLQEQDKIRRTKECGDGGKILKELNKKRVSKPTQKIDMSKYFDE